MVKTIQTYIIGTILLLSAGLSHCYAQTLNVTMPKDEVQIGEKIQLLVKVLNREEKEVQWELVISLLSKDPRAPVPRNIVKKVKLGPGKEASIPIALSTKGIVYGGDYEVVCKLLDNNRHAIAESAHTTRLAGGVKRLDIVFSTCKDKACKTPSKIFVIGETVYIAYTANVDAPHVEATVVRPDQSKETMTLPSAIVAKEAGDFQVITVAKHPGYRTVKKNFMFGVIEPSHQLNQPGALKQIE